MLIIANCTGQTSGYDPCFVACTMAIFVIYFIGNIIYNVYFEK
jgi:hypothetical protein